MHPHLSALVAEEHRHDLLREAEQHRMVATARTPGPLRPPRSWMPSLLLPALVLLRRVRIRRTPCEQQ